MLERHRSPLGSLTLIAIVKGAGITGTSCTSPRGCFNHSIACTAARYRTAESSETKHLGGAGPTEKMLARQQPFDARLRHYRD